MKIFVRRCVAAIALRLGACARGQGRCRLAARSGSCSVHCADQRGSQACFSSSEAAVSSASIAPSVSRGHNAKLRLALLLISMHAARWSSAGPGRRTPPDAAGLPAALGELAIGRLEAGRGGDDAVLPGGGVLVAILVQRASNVSLNSRIPPGRERGGRRGRLRIGSAATAWRPASSVMQNSMS